VSPIAQKLSFTLPLTIWIFGIKAGGFEETGPMIVGLLVELGRIAFGRRVDRGVETIRGKAPGADERGPRPTESLRL